MLDFSAILASEIISSFLSHSLGQWISMGKDWALEVQPLKVNCQWGFSWWGICFCLWRAVGDNARIRGQGGGQWNTKMTWYDRLVSIMNWQQGSEGGELPAHNQHKTLRKRRGHKVLPWWFLGEETSCSSVGQPLMVVLVPVSNTSPMSMYTWCLRCFFIAAKRHQDRGNL